METGYLELIYKEFNLSAYPTTYDHIPGSGDIDYPMASRVLPNGMIATRRLSFGMGRTLIADEEVAKERGWIELKMMDRFQTM